MGRNPASERKVRGKPAPGALVHHFLAWAKREGEPVQAMEDIASTERDKLIIRTLADTGIRVGELVKLRTGDLHSHGRQHYLCIRGKGSKERLVPIPRLYARLRRYADRGRPKDTTSDRLFISLKRRPESMGGASCGTSPRRPVSGVGSTPTCSGAAISPGRSRRGMHPVQIRQIAGHESTAMIDRERGRRPSDRRRT